VALVHEAPDWRTYRMDVRRPFAALEPLEQEIARVDAALSALVAAGVLPHARYDRERFARHRAEVAAAFDIPWTAITPRMHRLLYAINSIQQPRTLVAVGIFCGFTFIANAGAGLGAGACYAAERLLGIEIDPGEATRAARNVAAVDGDGRARILPADGVAALRELTGTLDLLYLDANGGGEQGKSIYLDMLAAARHALVAGSLVLAHNSLNCAAALADYLATVRDPANCRQSVNVCIDGEGLEVSLIAGAAPQE